jgi:hypothetical protein
MHGQIKLKFLKGLIFGTDESLLLFWLIPSMFCNKKPKSRIDSTAQSGGQGKLTHVLPLDFV